MKSSLSTCRSNVTKTIKSDEFGDFVLWEAEFIVSDEHDRITNGMADLRTSLSPRSTTSTLSVRL